MTTYSNRLQRLNDRRRGLYTKQGVYLRQDALTAPILTEKYAGLQQPEPVKYALGAMQPVDATYTKNTYAEGDRVRKQLLENVSMRATTEYQGSVPLDVHVRGNSDIDLLLLRTDYVTTEAGLDRHYHYDVYQGKPTVEALRDLRKEATSILTNNFPAAHVDTTGSKCITISGGSLRRVVDVIPSNWHDTLAWKTSGLLEDREVCILDHHAGTTINNRPFKHIEEIKRKCNLYNGSVRKVIRLLKNLSYDATSQPDISSYDIAAIVWHMNSSQLSIGPYMDLMLLGHAQNHLWYILNYQAYRDSLETPDRTRKIFNTPGKVTALRALANELDQLIQDIAKEMLPVYYSGSRTDALNKAIVL